LFRKRTFQIIECFWALPLYLLCRVFHRLQMPIFRSGLSQVEGAFAILERVSTGISIIPDTFDAFGKAS
jgi:hypothetical protein